MNTFVLIDGHHLIYRAFYAVPELHTRSGEPTNATYGFSSMLCNILETEQPTHVFVAFDHRDKTLRAQKDETYKAQRAPMPDALRPQVPRCREVVESLNIPQIALSGYEADDVMGTLSTLVEKEYKDTNIIIVTGDKDAFQLTSDRVTVAVPHKGHRSPEYFCPKKVYEKLGIRPDQVPDMKAFMGDPSDNIKGIEGIGPKGAVDLISTYGSVAGVFEHIEEISGKKKQKLLEGKADAFHCLEMATIQLDVPFDDFSFDSCRHYDYMNEASDALFQELQFYTLLTRMKKLQAKRDHPLEGVPAEQSTKGDDSRTEQLSLF